MGPEMIILFAVLWLAGWILAARFRRAQPCDNTGGTKDFSIIIPARDEAHNLPALLNSIARQTVAPVEVLVVDDGSADNTAEVARQLGATVVSSEPLPEGWRGKTWACHQGAKRARGSWLLFMDADTWFESGGLEKLVSIRSEGALSILPYHQVRSAYEGLSLFFNVCMTAGTVPDGLAGQCFAVKKDLYWSVGGHEAVRGAILENFQLAGTFRNAGVPVGSMTGKGILSIRMYPGGVRELAQGWAKGFASGAGGTDGRILLLVVAWMSGLMVAPLMVFLSPEWVLWLVAYLLCFLQVAWIGRKTGSFGWLVMFFYPMPLLFFFGLFAWSAIRRGRKTTWKGRVIDAD